MWKVILFTAFLYITYRFLTKDIRKSLRPMQTPQSTPTIQEGEMVLDPICNTYIVKNTSYSVEENDTIHYFCSTECKNNFLKQQ